jgi:XTP/dITP diphosphohydrolase
MPTILLATTNPHKVREVREVLAPLGYDVRSLDSLPSVPEEPVEDADTFAGNARLKAVAYARETGIACVAEDSGLEVDALGGAPGVYSARYAGASGSRDERDRANNQKLLRELTGVPPERRTARFVCAMCLAAPDGRVLAEVSGTYEGLIGEAPRGTNGFGYDPLLFLPDAGKTSAELSPEEKNARSHRGRATRALAERLRALRVEEALPDS